jgi:hypothetical protein
MSFESRGLLLSSEHEIIDENIEIVVSGLRYSLPDNILGCQQFEVHTI